MKKLMITLLAGALLLSGCTGGAPAPSDAPGVSAAVETSAPAASRTPRPTLSAPPEPSGAPVQTESAPVTAAQPGVSMASATPMVPGSAPPAPQSAAPASAAPEPYSQKTADTVLTITGAGVARDYHFTLAQLQGMSGGLVEEDYFSRGKEPQELTTHFKGVRVDYLLDSVASLAEGAKKASFTAADGYAAAFSLRQIRGSYLDETDPDKVLSMILAWEEDGSPTGLRLVMGQVTEGDYNRTNWVRDVVQIEVKAG